MYILLQVLQFLITFDATCSKSLFKTVSVFLSDNNFKFQIINTKNHRGTKNKQKRHPKVGHSFNILRFSIFKN